MAEHRMLSKQLLDSKLLDSLSDGAFRLYIQLNVNADDDGFINNAERITRSFGRSEDELTELWESGLLIKFSSGIYLITHWRVHNQLQKDRYNRTSHIEEMKLITWNNSEKVYRPVIEGVPNGLELIAEWFKESKTQKYQLTAFDKDPPFVNILYTKRIQDVNNPYTQVKLGKDSISKFSIAERSEASDSEDELSEIGNQFFG